MRTPADASWSFTRQRTTLARRIDSCPAHGAAPRTCGSRRANRWTSIRWCGARTQDGQRRSGAARPNSTMPRRHRKPGRKSGRRLRVTQRGPILRPLSVSTTRHQPICGVWHGRTIRAGTNGAPIRSTWRLVPTRTLVPPALGQTRRAPQSEDQDALISLDALNSAPARRSSVRPVRAATAR